ncbi:5-oxoprolinase subunit PxpB [Undibacterium sp. Di24W]
MSFYCLGERAVVMQTSTDKIDLIHQKKLWHVAQQLRDLNLCIDIVPGMNNLTAIFDPLLHSSDDILRTLKDLFQHSKDKFQGGREIAIPVHYGGDSGPDLPFVAEHCQLSLEDVVKRHCAANYVVYFLGFQPGFAYLGGMPESLATPRRAEPRSRVPAGSVGIGGKQTGIYPAASPGGWQLIGHTTLKLFDPQRAEPTLLQPGDSVRFVVEHIQFS